MKLRLSFRHLRNTQNTGDAACSPYDRWDWKADERLAVTVSDLREQGSDYDIGIFGGGKILRELAHAPGLHRQTAKINIGWGLSTVQRNPFSLQYRRAKRALTLVGSRDWDGSGGVGGFDWVPCASSEHTFFDKPPAPQTEVVVYFHQEKSNGMGLSLPDNIPSRSNHAGSFEDALTFLAMGETVISNSYHGVFWALLLGRRVICLPFSNKFNHYRLAPTFASARSWRNVIRIAHAQPELLPLCREATTRFRGKVMGLIEEQLSRFDENASLK